MKYFIVLALCLSAVVADLSADLHPRLFQEQFSHQEFFDNLRRQSQAAAYNGGASGFGHGTRSGFGSGYGGSSYGPVSGSGYGYRGVSVTSFSSSSDVNGKKTNQRGATTTINDNGKVTTYRVHS